MSHGVVEATGWELEATPWAALAACTGRHPGVEFFPNRGVNAGPAKALCGACPVRADCLGYALRWRIEHGIWGGLSTRERRRLPQPDRPRRLRPPHGTTAAYAAGCQCQECTCANAQYRNRNRRVQP